MNYYRNNDNPGDYLAELPTDQDRDRELWMRGLSWCLVANDPGDPDTLRRETVPDADILACYMPVPLDELPDEWRQAFQDYGG